MSSDLHLIIYLSSDVPICCFLFVRSAVVFSLSLFVFMISLCLAGFLVFTAEANIAIPMLRSIPTPIHLPTWLPGLQYAKAPRSCQCQWQIHHCMGQSMKNTPQKTIACYRKTRKLKNSRNCGQSPGHRLAIQSWPLWHIAILSSFCGDDRFSVRALYFVGKRTDNLRLCHWFGTFDNNMYPLRYYIIINACYCNNS